MAPHTLIDSALPRKMNAAKQPLHELFTDRTIDAKRIQTAIDEIDRTFDPDIDLLVQLQRDRQNVNADTKRSLEGKIDDLAAIAKRTETEAAARLPKLAALADANDKAIRDAEELADSLVLNPTLTIRRKQTDPSAEELANRQEFRQWARQTFFGPNAPQKPHEWRAMYRQWVIDDNDRARWAESDPVGMLVSADERKWARDYRVEHGALAPEVKVLRAEQRTIALLLEWIRREFKTPLIP